MQYTHKKSPALVRFLFLTLIGLGFIIAFIPFTGIVRSIASIVAIACIISGMLVFMKYEMTVYSIVINAKETDFNFFINKVVGRRGAYACYFLISDALKVVKYNGADSKSEISREYNGIVLHSYVHNINSKDRYAIIFLLDGRYDALIVELSPEALGQIEHFMSVAQAVNERHKEALGYGSDDDEDEESTVTDTDVTIINVADVDNTASNENEKDS